jgi:hypothetical protein
MISHGFEYSIFNDGYTTENLALFEERYQISVNIYGIGKDSPEQTKVCYSSIYNGDPDDNVIKVNLGILRNVQGDVHFVLVKKLQTIFITKNHEMHGHVKMCQDCGIVCSTTEQLLRHYKFEHKNETKGQQESVLPPIPEKAWIQFNLEEKHDFQKTQLYFFVCYADFECSNIPVQDPGTKKTKTLMRQIPNSIMVFCPDLMFLEDKRSLSIDTYLKKFHSDDPYLVVQEFIRALDTIRTTCIFRLQSHPKVRNLTKEEQDHHDHAKVCEKCKKLFDPKERPKVRHHCHITGKYIGAWCRKCNFLEGKNHFKLVIFFHNLRGYDSHMIIRYGLTEIAKLHGKDGTVEQFIIGKSAEKLSSFQFGHFVFRDSLLHLGCSLERAVDNLTKSQYSFPISEKLGLHPILRQKGIYLYKWVDSVEKFKWTELPGIEAFYNDLTQKPCSPEDYQHAQEVWKTLECKTFGDYRNYYLMADVVLLAEVFEEYRSKGLSEWQLDAAQFVTVRLLRTKHS